MIERICLGCGAKLQDIEESKPGFVPNLTKETKYCKRCFRLMNYNELPKIVATNSEYEDVIDSVIKKNGLIVFLVDIFSFKATFNEKLINKLRNKNVILVANKYDVFPKSLNVSKIVEWLSKQCEKIFFRVDAIHIVSSKKGYFIDELTNTIDMLRHGRDVYFIGCANVGKSSLINALLKRNTSIKNDVISTSVIPGTTLKDIKIEFFDDGKYLIDTPGLINEADVLNQILPKSYSKIMPKNEIKPITYQIENGNAIFVSGLLSMEFETNEKLSVILYTSNELYIHRCKSIKVDDLYKNQLGKILNPPLPEEVDNLKYLEKEIIFKSIEHKNLWFSGFGFVVIKGNARVKIKYLDKTEVYLTDAIIG